RRWSRSSTAPTGRWRCARRASSRTPSTSPSPASTTPSCCPTTSSRWRTGSTGSPRRSSASTPRPSSPPPNANLPPRPTRPQRVVASSHGERSYPEFSGVARSYNFYPVPPLRSEDGVAAVALGLGRTVVEGERCLSFCPRDPHHILQFSSVEDILANSQREF